MRFVPYIYPDLPDGSAYYQEPHEVLRVRRRQLGMSMQLASNRANMNYVKYRVYERGDLKLEKGGTKDGLGLCAALLLDPYSLLQETPAEDVIPVEGEDREAIENAVIEKNVRRIIPVNNQIIRRRWKLKLEKKLVADYAGINVEEYTAVEKKLLGFHDCPLRAGLRICTILRFDPYDLLPLDDVWQPSWEPKGGPWHALTTDDGSVISYQHFDEIFTNRRRQMKMTQQEVADKAGIPLRNYQKFETRNNPFHSRGAESVLLVCRAMDLDPYELLKIEKHLMSEEKIPSVKIDPLEAWVEP